MNTLARIHGGPDAQGVALHDFSSNANACGPCPLALDALQTADATRYPDPTYAALRERLAAFHGVAPQRIVLAASGSEFIFRITAWAAQRGARRVGLPRPGYGDYAAAAAAWGLAPVEGVGYASLAWACEPTSPLGQGDKLQALATRGGILVLDRAYEPLRLDGAIALSAGQLDRFWQLWSPNKALGLTGVRAAYAIAPDGGLIAAAQVEALAPSWPLGAHGVALLNAWCEPDAQRWLAQSLETLREWKARQVALCEELGWSVQPSQANFFTAQPGHPLNVASLAVQLRGHGIKLRDCASFGLPEHVRLSVQAPAAQRALKAAWEAIG